MMLMTLDDLIESMIDTMKSQLDSSNLATKDQINNCPESAIRNSEVLHLMSSSLRNTIIAWRAGNSTHLEIPDE